eukprot:768672-Hanusia_phi.AAC.18
MVQSIFHQTYTREQIALHDRGFVRHSSLRVLVLLVRDLRTSRKKQSDDTRNPLRKPTNPYPLDLPVVLSHITTAWKEIRSGNPGCDYEP